MFISIWIYIYMHVGSRAKWPVITCGPNTIIGIINLSTNIYMYLHNTVEVGGPSPIMSGPLYLKWRSIIGLDWKSVAYAGALGKSCLDADVLRRAILIFMLSYRRHPGWWFLAVDWWFLDWSSWTGNSVDRRRRRTSTADWLGSSYCTSATSCTIVVGIR